MARFTTTQSRVGGATSTFGRFTPGTRRATLIAAAAVPLFGTPLTSLDERSAGCRRAHYNDPTHRLEPQGTVIPAAALPPTRPTGDRQ